jgi:hypothetical protein
VKHHASPAFWRCYEALPEHAQRLARKSYNLLKSDPRHPSLHLKKTGRYFSVRIGLRHRALEVEVQNGILWFWIDTHAEYDRLLG